MDYASYRAKRKAELPRVSTEPPRLPGLARAGQPVVDEIWPRFLKAEEQHVELLAATDMILERLTTIEATLKQIATVLTEAK